VRRHGTKRQHSKWSLPLTVSGACDVDAKSISLILLLLLARWWSLYYILKDSTMTLLTNTKFHIFVKAS
jgi:hypothetical protein